jgi:predicted enzyme related to lactoylglutathione lyase
MAHTLRLPTLIVLALSASYCGDSPSDSGTSSVEDTSGAGQNGTTGPTAGSGPAKPGATAGAGAKPVATSAGASAGSAGRAGSPGSTAAAGTGPAAPSGSAGAGTSAAAGSGGPSQAGADAPAAGADGNAAAAGSSAPAAGAGGDASSGPIPDPVKDPVVWGVGVGVSDVPAAVKFYTEVMAMTVEKENVQREDRVETVLASTKAGRGSRLILMKYNDGRETRKISAKLVWQAPSPSSIDRAAAMHPDYVSRLNIGIVQFDGPDTYIQEVGSSFDTGGTGIMEPYMVALGFSVTSSPATSSFWQMIVGMEEAPLGSFTVTDASGTASIAEVTLTIPTGGGSAIIPQEWTPMRNSKDNPVKVVLFVPDAQAAAEKAMAAGGSIVQPAARSDVYENRLLIVSKDPDGYLVEIVQ